jgi:signal transduction histidine kinase
MRLIRDAIAELRALPTVDVALASVLALVGVLDVLLGPDWRGPATVNVIVLVPTALVLAWRRRRPLLSLGALGGLVLLSVLYGASQAWASVFIFVIAVYSVAAHASDMRIAVPLIAAGVIVRELNDPQVQTPFDALWTSSVGVLTFLAGLAGRSLHHRHRAIERRELALEEEEAELTATAAAEERHRIARELHDILSHNLGVLVLQAGAAEQVLERDPERAREALKWIRATGQEAISEMSTLLGLVRGEPNGSREPQPSLADIDTLIGRTRDAGLPVEIGIEGDQRTLPAPIELSAFRVVQEGLANAAKHATPTTARVILRYREDALEVEVLNDGIHPVGGLGGRRGLAGLGERLAVFGGKLQAGPDGSGGWRLCATFPVGR